MYVDSAIPVDNRPVSVELPTTHRELFIGFLTLGLMGFGGVLPLARHMIVEQKRWLTPESFAELLGLCQCLPGGNICNMSVVIGLEAIGPSGAIAALGGLLLAPIGAMIFLGVLYDRFSDNAQFQHMFAGLAAAAAGLLVATALKMLEPMGRRRVAKQVGQAVIIAAFFIGLGVLRTPLVPTMLVLAPFSVFVAWRSQ